MKEKKTCSANISSESAENDLIRVEWYNADEGVCGDYNPDDPDDVNLLRFDVYIKRNGSWEAVDDASYCTCMPADTSPEILRAALRMLLKEYTNALRSDPEYSVKKLGETMSWMSPNWFIPTIDERMIQKGIQEGLVRFVLDPNCNDGTVCQIGESWFYFGGLTAEQSKPEEYVQNVPEEDIVKEIFETLQSFKESGDSALEDEYKYYAFFLKENLSSPIKSSSRLLTLADLPILGGLKVLDAETKKVLHETQPGDPGDIAPDVALRGVVAVYAAGDQTVVEVLPDE